MRYYEEKAHGDRVLAHSIETPTRPEWCARGIRFAPGIKLYGIGEVRGVEEDSLTEGGALEKNVAQVHTSVITNERMLKERVMQNVRQ